MRIASGSKFYGAYVEIGEDVWIGPETVILSTPTGIVRIGPRVGIGPRVLMVSGTHEIGDSARRTGKGTAAPITIGSGSMVCAGSIVLAGAHIGAGSVVAAGAIVLEGEYPPNVMLAGVPATTKKRLDPV